MIRTAKVAFTASRSTMKNEQVPEIQPPVEAVQPSQTISSF
ncbi:hypothetical protein [Aneurinibacillus thermoaerophilus]|nr:hypothetical protein [Aneurinibacillus thermoaerophilus]MED0758067.1 hypothetical protein [Aneurinibacillus thermoaerophilus]MED0761221.1 hypothetical protein [Aneurinibacillus thermoaerophilus]